MKKKPVSTRVAALKAALSKEAAATYVEVSLEDVEKLLKRSFHSMKPKRGQFGGIYYYDLKLSDYVGIRVWSSVTVRGEMGRDVGESAIRVHLIKMKTGKPFDREKAPIVKRTQNWRTNLQDLVEETMEMYEGDEVKWEGRAGNVIRDPSDESNHAKPDTRSDYEKAKDEDGEGDGPSEPESKERAPRELDEIASWARTSTGDWGIAVKDPDSQEGDRVKTRTQSGDESTVTLAKFDREQYGKRIFFKGKQEGGRPQRSYGGGYDYRNRGKYVGD